MDQRTRIMSQPDNITDRLKYPGFIVSQHDGNNRILAPFSKHCSKPFQIDDAIAIDRQNICIRTGRSQHRIMFNRRHNLSRTATTTQRLIVRFCTTRCEHNILRPGTNEAANHFTGILNPPPGRPARHMH